MPRQHAHTIVLVRPGEADVYDSDASLTGIGQEPRIETLRGMVRHAPVDVFHSQPQQLA